MEQFSICEEAPVALHINGQKHVTFMCTPDSLKELAVGYLSTSKIIQALSDIDSVAACSDMKVIYAKLNNIGDAVERGIDLGRVITSGCGSGTFTEEFLNMPVNETDVQFSVRSLAGFASEMFRNAELYKKHGGVHISCLADTEKIITMKEDIGRHNTVDKVIGYAVLNGVNPKGSCIITSGRIAADMVMKALVLQVPVLVSRSIPTTLAVEIANEKGITLVGRILNNHVIFTHPERII